MHTYLGMEPELGIGRAALLLTTCGNFGLQLYYLAASNLFIYLFSIFDVYYWVRTKLFCLNFFKRLGSLF